MKLKEFALWAEIISAAAIVTSLIFVGIQINQNTASIESSNRESIVLRMQNMLLARATNADLAKLITDQSELEQGSGEYEQVQAYIIAQVRSLEVDYFELTNGRLN